MRTKLLCCTTVEEWEVTSVYGGEVLNSTYLEKLLGLHINADFKWNSHGDEISTALRQKIGLLKRIKQKIPSDKLIIGLSA